MTTTSHVERPTVAASTRTYCSCGNPWPCPQSPEGRWQALRDEIRRSRAIHYDAANDHGELTGHGVQELRAYGRVEMCDDLLRFMDRADEEASP